MHPTDPPLAVPIQAGERLLAMDVLRGMALLGVLIANVWMWFSGLYLRMAEFRPQMTRLTPDSVTHHLISIFISGKAIAVFSFLFGMGLAVQMGRARARGADVAPLYRRRMGVLLAMGVTHGVLLWYGDILTAYALLGFALLLFRDRGNRTLLAWAAVMLVGVPLAVTGWEMLNAAAPAAGASAAAAAAREVTAEALRSADPRRIVPENLAWIRRSYFGPIAFAIFPPAFGCFLLGLWAGRRRIFAPVSAHAAAFRRTAAWGLGVGLATGAAYQIVRVTLARSPDAPAWLPMLLAVLHVLAVVPLAAGYVSATVLLLERTAWRARLGVFAPVGCMALTNYLSQTVICLAVFYGGGLVGRVGVTAALGISLAVFAAQMAWSPWWLARYHFGPVEWAWRSLAYGRAQPMRIQPRTAVPGIAV